MKKYFMMAVAAAMFAACSNSDEELMSLPTQDPVVSGQTAVGFDVYAQRNVRRAGATGIINAEALQTSGFGVFAFYTNANEYDPQAVPNFMYNQQVSYADSKWGYTPVKYWPNEHGSNATSDDVDKLTFFAYAPYVAVVPSTGKLVDVASGEGFGPKDKWGITGMSRNSATGDPLIKYIASFNKKETVDLCWGVYEEASPFSWATNAGGNQSLEDLVGLPWMNIQRPDGVTGQNVKFTFKHALAQLNVQIDHDADVTAHADDETGVAAATKVYVRSISFTGMATKGSLNLNNTVANKALWLDYNGTADLESGEVVTIYDGRKDGKEGTAGAIASNEKTLGLNASIISDNDNTTAGVTNALQNLFAGMASADEPVYIIPTGEAIEVEIVYDIETVDANLATYLSDGKTTGSRIENRIKKTVTFGTDTKFENGKSYTLKLHLGMNSVNFDAAVSGWVDANAEGNAELPDNYVAPEPEP